MKMNLDYYYGHEAEQFTFFKIPKMLFTDRRFSQISSDAKILYGLLLDRMSLSIRNGWIDEENRVFIYFKLEEIMEYMGIGKDKGIKLIAELDCEKGCGLIKRRKQGLGKPTIIYVLNFIAKPNEEINNENVHNEADEETKLWHLSPLTLYNMYEGEVKTGKVVFPEEA